MLNGHGGNINQVCEKYGLDPDRITDFSASINPLGYPESLHKTVSERFKDILHYPDSECGDLRRVVADQVSCSESNVIIGNGSNELFYLIPRALKPEMGVIIQPTFSEFKDALCNANVEVVEILKEEKDFHSNRNNFSILKDIKEGIVFLCNPNNPTGELTSREEILDIVKANPDRLLIVDEAFMDFVEDFDKYSVIRDAPLMENLIVVKSLTKFYGFPGLRLGYLVANENNVKRLMKYKEPWTVNTFAQIAGNVAINDKEFFNNTRRYVATERDSLYDGLSMINGLRPLKPSANFLLVKINDSVMTSSIILRLLIMKDIIIRDCSNFIGLNQKYFRVAVRTREENQRLLDALSVVMCNMNTQGKRKKGFTREYATG